MCKTQCVLALAALYVGLAQSWDIAVSLGDQLIFYNDGTKTNTVNLASHNLTALAFDEVHNMMLYVDKQSDNDAICGYNLHSKENKCFYKRNSGNIHSIAFDPVTDTLFFTDMEERSINWVSLKPSSNNDVNLLFKMNDRTPTDIAVDSCRGYIYWTNANTSIEKARFNGSEREVIYEFLPVFTMAVDPQQGKVYFFDGCKTCADEFLNKADLNGNVQLYFSHTHLSAPKRLTVSKGYLYWMNSSESYTTVWYLPKNAMKNVQLKEFIKFYNDIPLAIVANYKLKDQGLQECEVQSSLIQTITETNNYLSIQQTTQTEQITEYATDELFCVHGKKVSETSVCECTPGYIGERCDVTVCENYCLDGVCSFNDEGIPKCRCSLGYSGERCEMHACLGFCLNNGDCSLNEKDEPVCRCVDSHEGTRCEAVKHVTSNNIPLYDSAKGNLTLADLLSRWRKPSSKMFLTVEV